MSPPCVRFDEKKYSLTGRRNRKSFTLGKALTVSIDRVDTDERQIILGLV
jgi:exoribonuclease R